MEDIDVDEDVKKRGRQKIAKVANQSTIVD